MLQFEFWLDIVLLVAALLFIIGLRRQSSPDTARHGNALAALGMGIAIVVVLVDPMAGAENNYTWIAGGLLLGGAAGYLLAMRVQMTAMPQLVSLFNGFGGACAVLLASVELYRAHIGYSSPDIGEMLIIAFTLLVGSVSFTGSLLAFAKLDGRVKDSNIILPRHQMLNTILMIITAAGAVYLAVTKADVSLLFILGYIVLTLVYGFSFVAPIGGADMPVVISLLNSFTGLTAAAAGLIYDNQIMLLGGILVGAAGTILTVLMCRAMNRSLFNVIIGGFGSSATGAAGVTGADGGVVKEISLPDAGILLYYSRSVVIVPGYGLAVAQAQKDCRELDELLEKNGVSVRYAIHPVAGRMPGHMNVLLAEADVPYPKLLDLDEANPVFPDTDVVVIVGANDVVNPAAQDNPGSPIYGMPVLEVWKAKNVIVMKRSMSAGYAGIENPLFFHEKTKMLFGDAKDSMSKLVKEVKQM